MRTLFPESTLPDDKNSPARSEQRPDVPLISFFVSFQFRFPELPFLFRNSRSFTTVKVPKTSVYQNYSPVARKDDIRFSGKSFHVHAITKTESMESTSYSHFRSGILAVHGRHDPGTRFPADFVHLGTPQARRHRRISYPQLFYDATRRISQGYSNIPLSLYLGSCIPVKPEFFRQISETDVTFPCPEKKPSVSPK